MTKKATTVTIKQGDRTLRRRVYYPALSEQIEVMVGRSRNMSLAAIAQATGRSVEWLERHFMREATSGKQRLEFMCANLVARSALILGNTNDARYLLENLFGWGGKAIRGTGDTFDELEPSPSSGFELVIELTHNASDTTEASS